MDKGRKKNKKGKHLETKLSQNKVKTTMDHHSSSPKKTPSQAIPPDHPSIHPFIQIASKITHHISEESLNRAN